MSIPRKHRFPYKPITGPDYRVTIWRFVRDALPVERRGMGRVHPRPHQRLDVEGRCNASARLNDRFEWVAPDGKKWPMLVRAIDEQRGTFKATSTGSPRHASHG